MLGKLNHNVDASYEYNRLAREDERVGLMLKDKGEHRHSIYFLIQAMEKYVRAKIFSIVDARNPYFRERERNHSVEAALEFLVEVINGNPNIKDQIKKQIREYVLGDVRFNLLHNNLRYPFYSERYNSYSSLDVTKNDSEIVAQRLNALKSFLAGVDRFK